MTESDEDPSEVLIETEKAQHYRALLEASEFLDALAYWGYDPVTRAQRSVRQSRREGLLLDRPNTDPLEKVCVNVDPPDEDERLPELAISNNYEDHPDPE